MDVNFQSIKSPLQMAGFYLAWIETVLAASFWPLKEQDKLLTVLLIAVVVIALIFAVGMVFILIHLVLKSPRWLYNPSDFDPSVQDELFKHDCSLSKARLLQEEVAATAGDDHGQS